MAGFLAAVSSVWVVVRSSDKASFASVGFRSISARWVLAGFGLGVVGWFLSIAVGESYSRVLGGAGNPRPDIAGFVAHASLLQLVLLVCVVSTVVPFAEELLFRGVLYTYLRRWGAAVAVFGSALAFGLSHGLSVVTLSTAALGILCALAYELSGSLLPAIAAHAAMNGAISAVSLFGS